MAAVRHPSGVDRPARRGRLRRFGPTVAQIVGVLSCLPLWTGVASPGLKLLPGLDGLADDEHLDLTPERGARDRRRQQPARGGARPGCRGRARSHLRREPALACRPPPRRRGASERRPRAVRDLPRRARRRPARAVVASRDSNRSLRSRRQLVASRGGDSAGSAAVERSCPFRADFRRAADRPVRTCTSSEHAGRGVHLGCAGARDRRRDVRRLGHRRLRTAGEVRGRGQEGRLQGLGVDRLLPPRRNLRRSRRSRRAAPGSRRRARSRRFPSSAPRRRSSSARRRPPPRSSAVRGTASPPSPAPASRSASQRAQASAGVCKVSGSLVLPTGVGTCTVEADQAGNSDFDRAPRVQQSFAVVAAPPIRSHQSISFTTTAPAAAIVGGADLLRCGDGELGSRRHLRRGVEQRRRLHRHRDRRRVRRRGHVQGAGATGR